MGEWGQTNFQKKALLNGRMAPKGPKFGRPHIKFALYITNASLIHQYDSVVWAWSALALCYSAAEYACPVWERSAQAKKLNATLNETCRMITGCLKPTNINSLPILAGIAPSDIRRAVASRTERTRQTMDERHPLNGHLGVVPRLKSRKSFIKCTEPINTTAKAVRLELWRERLEPLDASVHLNISADEHLPAGAENPWTTWKALNRLLTQVGRSRVNMSK